MSRYLQACAFYSLGVESHPLFDMIYYTIYKVQQTKRVAAFLFRVVYCFLEKTHTHIFQRGQQIKSSEFHEGKKAVRYRTSSSLEI